MKRCAKCTEWKPEDEFRLRASGHRFSYCKPCEKSYMAAYKKTPQQRQKQKEYRNDPRNTSRIVAYMHQYFSEHKDEKKQYDHVRRQDAEVKAVLYVQYHNRRAKSLCCVGEITVEQVEELWTLFGGLCAYCFGPADGIDHIEPLVYGGANEASNIVPCCRSCNSSKNARPLLVWLAMHRRNKQWRLTQPLA